MSLIHLHKQTLLSSDWHVLHRNIYYFVTKARSQIVDMDLGDGKIDLATFLEAEKTTYRKLYEEVAAALDQHPVSRFIFLGDLVFGLDRKNRMQEKLNMLAEELPDFTRIFELLKARGVQRVLLLGNHDDYKLRYAKSRELYAQLFDESLRYILEDDVCFTHFPLGYSHAHDQTAGTADEKYYRISKSFKKIDQQLLAQIGDRAIINYHGHIHEGNFPYALPSVDYRNMAIDILATS